MNSTNQARIILGLRGFAAMLFSLAASPVLYSSGISFKIISLGFGFLYVVLAIFEIPTGIWADIFGAKNSSIFGGLLQTFSLTLFLLAPKFPIMVIVAYTLYGLGTSFISGALTALLYSHAKETELSNFNSNKYFSLIEKTSVASYVIASLGVGFFTKYLEIYSLLLASFVFLISTFIFGIIIPDDRKNPHHRPLSQFLGVAKNGYNEIKNNFDLKLLMPLRLLNHVESILGILWLPWISKLGGSDLWFSVMATGSYFSRYIVNHYFAKKDRPNSYYPRILNSILIMITGTIICALSNSVYPALIGVWLMAGARGVFLPANQAIMHDSFSESSRSTGISMMNFIFDVFVAVGFFSSSLFVDKIEANTAWWITSGAFFISILLIVIFRGVNMKTGLAKGNEIGGEGSGG